MERAAGPEADGVSDNDGGSENNGALEVEGVSESTDSSAAFPREISVYRHFGAKLPSYPPEPSAAVNACEDAEGALVPDTLVNGFAVGMLVVRAASIAGDAHRYEGKPRQDALAAVTFGPGDRGLVLAVVADGVGSQRNSHVGAATACKATVATLAQRARDVETALRGGLRDRVYYEVVHVVNKVAEAIEAEASRQSVSGRELATTFRAVLVPADPEVRARLAFSVGDGATFRLAETAWTRIQSTAADDDVGVQDTSTAVLPLHPEELRVDMWTADPGDTIVVCTDGFSEPLRDTDSEFASTLAEEWSTVEVPGMMRFLWQAESRLRSYDDDRTVICIWDRGTTSPAA